MASSDEITITVAGIGRGGLAAYGCILQSGEHRRELSACFPFPPATVLMEGVVAAFIKIKSKHPHRVTVQSVNSYEIRSHLQTTPFPHLRDVFSDFEQFHKVSWESSRDDHNLTVCRDLAGQAISRYLRAMSLIEPARDIIERAARIFSMSGYVQLGVQERDKEGVIVDLGNVFLG